MKDKINRAIRLIQSVSKRHGTLEVSYSGGKDSDVILELTKMAEVPYIAVYKNTTIDPPGNIAYVKSKGAKILHPETSFFELVAKKGYPNRMRRFCCQVLKEGAGIEDAVVLGIRTEESCKRRKLYREPVVCNANGGVSVLPIMDWRLLDLRNFIEVYKVKLNPIYEENGFYNLNLRLGCVGCPLAYYKHRLIDFAKYPKMANAWINAGDKFLMSNQKSKPAILFDSAKEWFVSDLFASIMPYKQTVEKKKQLCEVFDGVLSGDITISEIKEKGFRKKFGF